MPTYKVMMTRPILDSNGIRCDSPVPSSYTIYVHKGEDVKKVSEKMRKKVEVSWLLGGFEYAGLEKV